MRAVLLDAEPPLARVDLARAAVRMAEKGWFVFPCHSVRAGAVCSCGTPFCGRVGKHPRTKNGFKDATTDVKQIAAWWLEWPDANIGLVPWPSDLIVLDVDPRNDGQRSFEELEKQYGKFPDTARVLTGGGGFHLYFSKPYGTDKCPSRVLRPGIELKAQGGYVIAPPSSHLSVYLNAAPASVGAGYAWDPLYGDAPVDAPFWLVEAPPPGKVYERGGRPPIESVLGAAFVHAGMAGRALGSDKVAVQCPWEAEHTGGETYDSSTVVFGPSAGSNLGFFHCSHSHCTGRSIRDVLAALPQESVNHAKEVVPKATKALSTVAGEEWEKLLARQGTGALAKDPGNLRLLIENIPEWQGALALDESRGKFVWKREMPIVPGQQQTDARLGQELRDGDYIDVAHWFRMVRGVTFRKEVVIDVLHHTAERSKFNGLREHLAQCLDGHTPGRGLLSNWLVHYCNAENSEYVRSVGRWWLVSAMARAMDPGVQADHCLVLEGDQGVGKSTLFRLLGADWYDGSPPRFDSTDALLSFQGVWIREFSELAGTTRTEFATIKALLTERCDRFRPPYGRHLIEAPRRCVFCASVNPGEDYVKDASGARRFWPVRVGRIDVVGFQRDRAQLLGEAMRAYQSGETFHPPLATATTEALTTAIKDTQGARQVRDPWTQVVLSLSESEPTTDQIFRALAIPIEHQDARGARRIGVIMRAHGHELKRKRDPLLSGSDDRPGHNQVYKWIKQ